MSRWPRRSALRGRFMVMEEVEEDIEKQENLVKRREKEEKQKKQKNVNLVKDVKLKGKGNVEPKEKKEEDNY